MSTTKSDVPLIDRFATADVDSHIIEPPDLWTSRLSKQKWGDLVPHVRYDDRSKEDRWFLGDRRLFGVGAFAQGGWSEYPPGHPRSWTDVNPDATDPKARLAYNDRAGIHYQLLYGNILGFHSHFFLSELPQELATECVIAYNDWLVEFCSADPKRLIPLMMLPFWDVEASVKEMHRAAPLGHRGIIFTADFEKIGLPALPNDHWAPILSTAQEMKLPVNFHVGFAASKEEVKRISRMDEKTKFVKESALAHSGNANTIAEVVLGGLAERYPELPFVSVENGVGWLPYFCDSLDWQWRNSGAALDFPGRLLPSEYIKRQIYVMYWFERETLAPNIPFVEDNLMFETDFPHPTSLTPGPASAADEPRVVVEATLGGVSDEVAGKILQHTATRLYRLEPPEKL